MMINGKPIEIKDIMRPAVSIEESATLETVLRKMIEEKRNSLIVVDKDGRLIGGVNAVDIIKEVLPDYLEQDAIAARFADAALLREDAQRVKDKPVSEFMAMDMPTIALDGSLVEAAVTAIKHGRGRIVVIDEDRKPLGILTRTEIKQVIGDCLDIPSSFNSPS